MGREIRMVPPNWEHPQKENLQFKRGIGYVYEMVDRPMYGKRFEDAAAEWKAEYAKWEAGERPSYCDDPESRALEYWEWSDNPPDREYYRPWKDEEATWFQLWQTVSEGTPVSPPFATREELADYLAENGDFWDQKRGNGGWGRASADAFVEVGWAPTLATKDGVVIDGRDVPLKMGSE